jgi:hypothetical protein
MGESIDLEADGERAIGDEQSGASAALYAAASASSARESSGSAQINRSRGAVAALHEKLAASETEETK